MLFGGVGDFLACNGSAPVFSDVWRYDLQRERWTVLNRGFEQLVLRLWEFRARINGYPLQVYGHSGVGVYIEDSSVYNSKENENEVDSTSDDRKNSDGDENQSDYWLLIFGGRDPTFSLSGSLWRYSLSKNRHRSRDLLSELNSLQYI